MNRTFATLFPRLVPVAFNKGVGRLAYHFAHDLGWRSILAYCDLQPVEAPGWYTNVVETHRLGEVGLEDRRRQFLMLADFLVENSERIDVLNLYDLRWESFGLAALYKSLNPNGVVFIKTDMDQRAVDMLVSGGVKVGLYASAMAYSAVDFFTVETTDIHEQIRPFFEALGKPLHLIPIGFDAAYEDIQGTMTFKENLVISVGRTGSEQKNNELLLRSVLNLPGHVLKDWTFVWIGEDEGGFRKRARELMKGRNDVEAHVRFVEHVDDRGELLNWYRRARFLAVSSRWESFATVLAEVPYFGAIPITTRVGAAWDVTRGGELGFVVPSEDLGAYSAALLEALMSTEERRRTMGTQIHEHIKRGFSWEGIVTKLQDVISMYTGDT